MGEYIFLGSALLAVASGAILLRLNPNRNVNRAFFLSSICVAVWASCIGIAIHVGRYETTEPNQYPLLWIRASLAAGAFIGWSAWLIRNAIIYEDQTFAFVVLKSWLFLLIACIAASIGISELYVPSDSTQADRHRGVGFVIYFVMAASSCLLMLVDGLRQHKVLTGIRKIEMQFFVLGLICSCILLIASNSIGNKPDLERIRHLTPIWFVTLHVAVVWAVCSHKVFEAKHLVTSIGYRTALLLLVGASAHCVQPICSRILGEIPATLFSAVSGGAFALMADPTIRRFLKIDLERILRTPRQAAIEAASRISDDEALRKEFTRILKDLCQTDQIRWLVVHGVPQSTEALPPSTTQCLAALVCSEGWITPEAIERRRRNLPDVQIALDAMGSGAIVAAPRNSATPSLVVSLGKKASLRPYTYPDVEVLLNVIELMDNLLTHSRAAANASRAEKLAAAAMISRGLAHDLNNLATPVASFLSHMSGRVASHSSEGQVLADANAALGVMQGYIRDSLFFSRNLTPKLEAVNARRLLHSVIRLSEQRAAAGAVSLAAEADRNFWFMADQAMMQRLLQNLIFNGLDVSPPQGSIRISARIGEGERVVLSVADEGPGVPVELREKIFEPYYTTKDTGNKSRGLGLGLAICRKIAELHQADITVQPNSPRGATFLVTFPVTALEVICAGSLETVDQPHAHSHEDAEIAARP